MLQKFLPNKIDVLFKNKLKHTFEGGRARLFPREFCSYVRRERACDVVMSDGDELIAEVHPRQEGSQLTALPRNVL